MWRIPASVLLTAELVLGPSLLAQERSAPDPDAPPELVSPYHEYDLKLRVFYPAPRCPAGVLLPVRINGGRPLRMLLDSGADIMVVRSKDARSAGLSSDSELDLVGLGSRSAQAARAETVEIGPVTFRHCHLAVVDGKVAEGEDGIIPLRMFSQFLLHMDLPGKTLQLSPYPGVEEPPLLPTRAAPRHDLLLVAAVLNGTRDGYVAVDTGSFCSVISREVARTLGGFPTAAEVPLAAGTGAATGHRVLAPVHFAIAQQDLVPDNVVAVDLSNLSLHYGVEVIGVLGFPALTRYVLTIDYRHHQVKIEPPQRIPATDRQPGSNAEPPAPLAFR